MKSTDIEALLPAVIRQTIEPQSPAAALLQVMEELQAPTERILATIDSYFSAYRARDEFVPTLAVWVDLDRFANRLARGRAVASWPVPLSQLREWVAAAVRLSRRRGTAAGLRQLLEVATGMSGYQILEGLGRDGRPRPFHLRVIAPAGARPQQALITRIIALEKPAYMTSDPVEFADLQPEQG